MSSVPDLRHTYQWAKTKRIVKVRDQGCVICKSRNKLEVHHLRDATHNVHLFFDLDNLVTLCEHHHHMFHILYKGSYKRKCYKIDFKRYKRMIKLIEKDIMSE